MKRFYKSGDWDFQEIETCLAESPKTGKVVLGEVFNGESAGGLFDFLDGALCYGRKYGHYLFVSPDLFNGETVDELSLQEELERLQIFGGTPSLGSREDWNGLLSSQFFAEAGLDRGKHYFTSLSRMAPLKIGCISEDSSFLVDDLDMDMPVKAIARVFYEVPSSIL